MKKLTEDSQAALTNPLVLLASIYRSLSKIWPFKEPFQRFEQCTILFIQLSFRTIKIYNEINEYLAGIIQEHEKSQDFSQEFEPRDFIDSYLLEWDLLKCFS